MRNIASLPADRFDELLRRLRAGLDLDALAQRTKAIERKREIDTGANLLRLALARGPGGLSLSQTAAWATMLGLAEMSDPGVKNRLDKAVEFLDAVMASQLAQKAPGAAVRWAGRTLRLGDGSCFRERGAKTTSWRLHGVYDLGRGGFSHLALTDQHGAETIEYGTPLAGEIRICDRGFARAPSLHRFRQQSANKADFIIRVGWAAFSLTGQDGADFDLIGHLGQLPADRAPYEVAVRAKLGPLDPALPVRLVIQRKTPPRPPKPPVRSCAVKRRASKRLSIRAAWSLRSSSSWAHRCRPKDIRPKKCSPSIACAGRSNWRSSG